MLNLIKLEIKKFKLEKYVTAALITQLILVLSFLVVIIVSNFVDDVTFGSLTETLMMMDNAVRIVFVMFASVMLSNIVIGEYSNKTINLMFTYPIQRKKIFLSKILLVTSFTFINIIVCNILLTFELYFINSMTTLLPWRFSINEVFLGVPNLLINSALACGTSLIALYFGMRKKSTVVTILSTFLVCSVLYSNYGSFTLSSFLPIPIIAAVIGLVIVFGILNKLDYEDIT